jgi:hypothetical protein
MNKYLNGLAKNSLELIIKKMKERKQNSIYAIQVPIHPSLFCLCANEQLHCSDRHKNTLFQNQGINSAFSQEKTG